jgi:hypothetical protein
MPLHCIIASSINVLIEWGITEAQWYSDEKVNKKLKDPNKKNGTTIFDITSFRVHCSYCPRADP